MRISGRCDGDAISGIFLATMLDCPGEAFARLVVELQPHAVVVLQFFDVDVVDWAVLNVAEFRHPLGTTEGEIKESPRVFRTSVQAEVLGEVAVRLLVSHPIDFGVPERCYETRLDFPLSYCYNNEWMVTTRSLVVLVLFLVLNYHSSAEHLDYRTRFGGLRVIFMVPNVWWKAHCGRR